MDCSSFISGSSSTASSIRQSLVCRANRIIEQYNLPVPRSCTLTSINYHFWSAVFNKVYGIRCNSFARNRGEHIGHLKACLNMMEIVLEIPVSHIQANRLLDQDINAIQNLLEIVELCEHSQSCVTTELTTNQINVRPHLAIVDLNLPVVAEQTKQNQSASQNAVKDVADDEIDQVRATTAKGFELAEKLEKSLKNQILAMEIGKKVKMYLGDVSVAKVSTKNNPHVRATRQSVVRTRCIQPNSGVLSSFNLASSKKGSSSTSAQNILSIDLLRLFPELSNEQEMLEKIQSQEKRLLMSERQIQVWASEKADRRLNRLLEETINYQRQRLALQEKEALRELDERKKTCLPKQLSVQNLQNRRKHNERLQKATFQREIEDFYQQSTAAYLSARSTMEKILVEEFKKVDSRQRQQICEIRKYLQNYYEVETDKLRVLLDNFDEILR